MAPRHYSPKKRLRREMCIRAERPVSPIFQSASYLLALGEEEDLCHESRLPPICGGIHEPVTPGHSPASPDEHLPNMTRQEQERLVRENLFLRAELARLTATPCAGDTPGLSPVYADGGDTPPLATHNHQPGDVISLPDSAAELYPM